VDARERWVVGLGDPSIVGWFIVFAYFVAFLLCLRVGLKAAQETPWPRRTVASWCSLAALLLFLCINKQLDLQSLLTQIVRDHSLAHGWHSVRRYYQIRFMAGLGLLSVVAALLLMLSAIRARSLWTRVACFGTILLMAWILLRASSFHLVDQRLAVKFWSMNYNWIAELTPIFMICIAAWRTRRRRIVRQENRTPLTSNL
jgi:hypothetical protein